MHGITRQAPPTPGGPYQVSTKYGIAAAVSQVHPWAARALRHIAGKDVGRAHRTDTLRGVSTLGGSVTGENGLVQAVGKAAPSRELASL